MGDTFRIQFDAAGQEVNTTLDAAMRQDAPAVPSTPRQTSAMRGKYNTEDGTFTLEENRPSGMRVAPSVEQASARNAQGLPVPLFNAKPTDVVTLLGEGDTLASVWEAQGRLRRLPGGMGYEVVGQESQQKQEQKPVAEKKPEELAADVRGIEPTSNATDATLKTLASDEPAALEGLITSLSQTGDLSPAIIADIARQRGIEESVVQSQVSSMVQDHVRAAQQAVKNVDATIDPAAFQAWLLKNPDLADRVTRDVMNKSVHSVQAAARQYAANRQTALRSALEGHGLNVWEDHGTLFVTDFPGAPKKNISVRELVERGLLTISE